MDESRGYFKLGLFVLIALGILAACAVALGAHLFSHLETIQVETLFSESVAGLETGSPVKYRGVTIGKISQITFADAKYDAASPRMSDEPLFILVEMSIDPRKFRPGDADQLSRMLADRVAHGLRVRISRPLIGQGAAIDINYVDPTLYPPPKLSWTPTGLYIPSAPSEMNEVVGGLDRLVVQLNNADIPGIVRRIDKLVADLDKGVTDLQVATLRDRVLTLADEVRDSNRHLNEILASPEVKQVVADLPVITGRLKNSSARIEEILHDKRIDQIVSGLASTTLNAGPAAADARRLIAELRDLVASENDDIRVIVNNLRDMTDDGRSTLDDLKQNPSRLIFGSPPSRIEPGKQ